MGGSSIQLYAYLEPFRLCQWEEIDPRDVKAVGLGTFDRCPMHSNGKIGKMKFLKF